jgi:hypothetical protein
VSDVFATEGSKIRPYSMSVTENAAVVDKAVLTATVCAKDCVM